MKSIQRKINKLYNINIILALFLSLPEKKKNHYSCNDKNCIEKRTYNIIFPRAKEKSPFPNLLPYFRPLWISSLPSPYPRIGMGRKIHAPTSLEQSFQRINLAIIQSRPASKLQIHTRGFILSPWWNVSPSIAAQPAPEVGGIGKEARGRLPPWRSPPVKRRRAAGANSSSTFP